MLLLFFLEKNTQKGNKFITFYGPGKIGTRIFITKFKVFSVVKQANQEKIRMLLKRTIKFGAIIYTE